MKGKHLVYKPEQDGQPQMWYKGLTFGLRGSTWPEEWTPNKAEATWLTQQQAKRLIDSQRHRKVDCNAEPSFTVVY